VQWNRLGLYTCSPSTAVILLETEQRSETMRLMKMMMTTTDIDLDIVSIKTGSMFKPNPKRQLICSSYKSLEMHKHSPKINDNPTQPRNPKPETFIDTTMVPSALLYMYLVFVI